MRNKTKGLLFRLPTAILLIAGFIGSIYAKIKNIDPVTNFGPAVIFAILIILYIIGEYFNLKKENPAF